MPGHRRFTPLVLPIVAFLAAILIGTFFLRLPFSLNGKGISLVDALFTATSAVCVTGLVVQDTGTFFSPLGQMVILVLIQAGGLGVMTYTSLVLIVWRKRISLTDRLAVGQSLLHDPSFNLKRFLGYLAGGVFFAEMLGAGALWLTEPGFTVFSCVFHSISAFCNAGFSLYSDSLMGWSSHTGVNLIVMLLIVLGGLGFSVLNETLIWARNSLRRPGRSIPGNRLSLHAATVWSTSLWLIFLGAVALYFIEILHPTGSGHGMGILTALFQSVTARTAGFNTLDIAALSNVSLLVLIFLMFVGGSPGSCAGGIKTTTLRTLTAFISSQFRDRRQTVLGERALDSATVGRALTLLVFAVGLVFSATVVLCITEGAPGAPERGLFLEALFESVSAFGTVGLSTGLTADLSLPGKLVIIPLMLIGRIGPIVFLGVLQDFHKDLHYRWPEEGLMIG